MDNNSEDPISLDIQDLLNKIIVKIESDYLIIKNRQQCQTILLKEKIDSTDLIDAFVSLHLIMEVGLNGLFRQLSLRGIKKGVSEIEIVKNLDNINFIDKTVLFIYNSNFNFDSGDELILATDFHKIIGKLRNFSYIRNALLHGHTISSVNDGGVLRDSTLKSKLTIDNLNRQIEDFRFILDGIDFYVSHLSPKISQGDLDLYRQRYLSSDFIPHEGKYANLDTDASTQITMQRNQSATARIIRSNDNSRNH